LGKSKALKKNEEDDDKEPLIVYSRNWKVYSEDEKIYSEFLKLKRLTQLIQEFGILKNDLKFFEREIDSRPKDKADKARRRKDWTFTKIYAVEMEIAKRMNASLST
jgi:hypothetical protein